MGDFNANLINYDNCKDTQLYLDSLCSYSFFPFITLPTRVNNRSKTLIDNVFMNFHSPDIVSGNLTISHI